MMMKLFICPPSDEVCERPMVYEYLEDNPQIIVHGFRHAGLYNALG